MLKFKKLTSLVATGAMVVSMFAGMTFTSFADTTTYTGQTTTGDYTISTSDQLETLAEKVNAGTNYSGSTFTLTADIDMSSETTWEGIGNPDISSASTYSPKVSGGTGFVGTLDGGIYTNGTLTGTHYIKVARTSSGNGEGGVVNYLAPGGEVKNLTVKGSVTNTGSNKDAIGGVVGFNAGTIYNVTNEASVTATSSYNAGGIAGFNDRKYTSNARGYIYYCSNSGAVAAKSKAGGIAGENAGYIAACSNSGAISNPGSGKNGAGGIAGRNGNNNSAYEVGVIRNCYNTGTVTVSNGRWGGGIAGFQSAGCSTINCYSTKTATGYRDVGYIIGNNEGTSSNNTNATSTSSVSASTLNANAYADGITATSAVWADDTSSVNDGYPVLTNDATGLDIEKTTTAGGNAVSTTTDKFYVKQGATGTADGTSAYPFETLSDAVDAANNSTASAITIYINGTYTFAASDASYALYGNVSSGTPITTIKSTTTSSTGSLLTVASGADVYIGGLKIDGTGFANTINDSGSLAIRNQAVVTGGTTAVNVNAGGSVLLNRSTISGTNSVVLAAADTTNNLAAATCRMSVNTNKSQKLAITGTFALGTGTSISTASSPALMLTNALSVTCDDPYDTRAIVNMDADADFEEFDSSDVAKVTYSGSSTFHVGLNTNNDQLILIAGTQA